MLVVKLDSTLCDLIGDGVAVSEVFGNDGRLGLVFLTQRLAFVVVCI